MKVSAFLASLSLLASAPPAQAANCVPREDVKQVLLFAMPHVADAVRSQCGPALAKTAFLNSEAYGAYHARLQADRPSAGPSIVRFLHAMGEDLPEEIGPESVESITKDMLANKLAGGIKPQSCPIIDDLVASAARLPDEQLFDFFAVLLQLADASDKKGRSDFNICRVETQP